MPSSLYVGWGHSTWQEGAWHPDAAKVKQLVLFHHDPSHDDDFMDKVVAEATSLPRHHRGAKC
jgi:phosphoribosyl 1,2-cyclic phosphodiesterase